MFQGVFPDAVELGCCPEYTASYYEKINALHRAYPDCRVYTSEYGKVALFDENKNFSKYHESPFVYEGTDVKTYGVCVLDIQICSFFKLYHILF